MMGLCGTTTLIGSLCPRPPILIRAAQPSNDDLYNTAAPHPTHHLLSYKKKTAYGNLAAILAREERHSEAEYAYRQALAHRPNMAETHFNL